MAFHSVSAADDLRPPRFHEGERAGLLLADGTVTDSVEMELVYVERATGRVVGRESEDFDMRGYDPAIHAPVWAVIIS
jgi:hypothetical protein